jgi:large conductance mechanosensitive channel
MMEARSAPRWLPPKVQLRRPEAMPLRPLGLAQNGQSPESALKHSQPPFGTAAKQDVAYASVEPMGSNATGGGCRKYADMRVGHSKTAKLAEHIDIYSSLSLLYEKSKLISDIRILTNEIGCRMLDEFKKFALRGNVVDLAVGVIIGAAFGAIVSSMVGDLIMPIVGAVSGGLDFSNYYLPLSSTVKTGLPLADAKKVGAVLAYGNFITATINFLIVAFVLFIAIQAMNRLKGKEVAQPSEPAAPTKTEILLAEIRDALKK